MEVHFLEHNIIMQITQNVLTTWGCPPLVKNKLMATQEIEIMIIKFKVSLGKKLARPLSQLISMVW
jgi:hypothetical protein